MSDRLLAVLGAAMLVVVVAVAGRLAAPVAFLSLVPALFVVLAAVGYGAAVLRLLGGFSVLDRERWVWAAVLGLGVVGTLQSFLAHLHLFAVSAASVVVAVGFGLLLLHGRELVRDLDPPREPGALWLAALSPAAVLVVARASVPPTFYDALVYHLGLPMQFAARGGAVVDVHETYSAMPLLAEMAASPALLLGGPEGAGFVYALEWILLAAAVFVLVRRAVPDLPRAGGAAAFVVAGMPLAVFLPSGTKPDLLAALFSVVVLRVLVRLSSDDGPTRAPLVRIGALCTGFAVATKTTFLVWAVVIALVAGVLELRARRLRLLDAAAAVALVIAGGAFPYVRNLVALGAPLYPFAGGPAWADHTRALLNADAKRPHDIVDVLSLPWTLSVDNDPTADEVLGVVWWVGLAALALLRPKGAARPLFVVAAVLVLSLPGWLLTHALPRYDPFLWLGAGIAAGVGLGAARGRAAIPVVAAALVAGAVGLGWNAAADDVLLRGSTAAVIQRTSRDQLVAGAVDLAGAYRFLGEHAPNGCVFLATGDPRIAYLDVPAVLSEVYARPLIDELVAEAGSVDDVVARIRATGATHVLLGKGAVPALRRRGWAYFDAAAQARYAALPGALGAPIYEDAVALAFAVPSPVPGPCAAPR